MVEIMNTSKPVFFFHVKKELMIKLLSVWQSNNQRSMKNEIKKRICEMIRHALRRTPTNITKLVISLNTLK